MTTSNAVTRWFASHPWWLLLVWLIPVCLLPVVPIDETRYLTIAWEMRLSGDMLGLTLNGQPYMDKSPLLFWLIDASWRVFGVSTWAARLVDVALAAGTVGIIGRLAERLDARSGWAAGWVLAPFFLFGAFAGIVMFDMVLCFFVVLALHAFVSWIMDGKRGAPALFFVAASLGMLAKGPVFLLHIAAPLSLARWWLGRPIPRAARIVPGVVAILLLAALPLAGWAIAGAARIHDVPVMDTLLKQTVGRVADSYSHRRPFYWYLPLLPLLLLPWSVWLRWRRVPARVVVAMTSPLGRFGAAASLPAFIAFSLISGKQVHYLLPLLPGVAMFIAAMVGDDVDSIGFGAWALRHRGGDHAPDRLRMTSAVSTLMAVGLVLLVGTQLKTTMDPTVLAKQVVALRERGVTVGVVDEEPGLVGYLARLPRPLPLVRDPVAWATEHPDGVVLMRASHGERPAWVENGVDLSDGWEGLVPAAALAKSQR